MIYEGNEWRLIPIEPGVAQLVAALNRLPTVKTVASCEGHFSIFEFSICGLYVAFTAAHSVAAKISKCLRDVDEFYVRKTKAYWSITGSFNENDALDFSLAYNEDAKTFRTRNALNNEVLMVIEILNQLEQGLSEAVANIEKTPDEYQSNK